MKPGESGRILVVDDQATVAEMTAGLLRALGHEVQVALDGEAALEHLSGGRFDLVLCDIMMPGMDGYELCRRLRGFPSFTDRADPEEVMDLLGASHVTLGRIVEEFGGTLEHFAGDGVMIFFNDPFPVARPAERAVRMSMGLQLAFEPIAKAWDRLGHQVGLGIGIAQGEATLGGIGFEQRWEYAAIGNVPNPAARLCGEGRAGEIILDAPTEREATGIAEVELIGPLALR